MSCTRLTTTRRRAAGGTIGVPLIRREPRSPAWDTEKLDTDQLKAEAHRLPTVLDHLHWLREANERLSEQTAAELRAVQDRIMAGS